VNLNVLVWRSDLAMPTLVRFLINPDYHVEVTGAGITDFITATSAALITESSRRFPNPLQPFAWLPLMEAS